MNWQLNTLPKMIEFVLFVFFAVSCASASPQSPAGTWVTTITEADSVSAPTLIAASGEKEWDYVALGDSMTWNLIPRYAAFIEQDLGVKVNVHNWTSGGQTSSDLLNQLRTNSDLRRNLQKARVVTFNVPLGVFAVPMPTYVYGGDCGGVDNQNCLRDALTVHLADTDAIFAEIVSVRSPSDALIRTMDTYVFEVKDVKAHGAFPVIDGYFRKANQGVNQAASKYQIPVAPVYTAFMGSNSGEDPMEKGLVGDGFHSTDAKDGGADLMAKLFRELGYEFAPVRP